jgi:hypothetical protein
LSFFSAAFVSQAFCAKETLKANNENNAIAIDFMNISLNRFITQNNKGL